MIHKWEWRGTLYMNDYGSHFRPVDPVTEPELYIRGMTSLYEDARRHNTRLQAALSAVEGEQPTGGKDG